MSNLKNQLIKLGSENPELQEDIRPVLDSLSKKAGKEGPAEKALHKHWGKINEINNALHKTIKPYNTAASFVEGVAEKDAIRMIRLIEDTQEKLERVSTKAFDKLMGAERDFVKKYGPPEEYVEKERRKMYSSVSTEVTAEEMLDMAVRKGFIDKSDTRDRALREAAEDWAFDLQLKLEKNEKRAFGFGTSDYNYYLAQMIKDAKKRGFETGFSYDEWAGR